MAFSIDDRVGVYVPPVDDFLADADTGTVKAVLPASEYDVFRDQLQENRNHREEHLFALSADSVVTRQHIYRGFKRITKFGIEDQIAFCRHTYRTKSGRRI